MKALNFSLLSTVIVLIFTGCGFSSDFLEPKLQVPVYGSHEKYEDPREIIESTKAIPAGVRDYILRDARVIKRTLNLPGSSAAQSIGSDSRIFGMGIKKERNRWNDGVSVNAMAQKYFPDDVRGADKIIDVIALYGNGKMKQRIRAASFQILEAAYRHQAGEIPYEIGEDGHWSPAYDFGAEPAKLFEYVNGPSEDNNIRKEALYDDLKFKDGLGYYKGSKTPFSGVAYEFYWGGRQASRYEFLNGKKEGRAASWYKNGQIENEMSYRSNLLHGRHTYWDQKGEILIEVNYIKGKAN